MSSRLKGKKELGEQTGLELLWVWLENSKLLPKETLKDVK